MSLYRSNQARTTPAIRREIQTSNLSERQLARQHGLTRATVRKWRSRTSVEDASHRPHKLYTTLTPAQEAIVVYLRQNLLLPLDDLRVITREFLNPDVSRSGLDRCLRRHGIANLKTLLPTRGGTPRNLFKGYKPGCVYIDVKDLPAIAGEPRRYLFVAIDRATRWIFVDLKRDRSVRSAGAFLKAVIEAAPFRLQACLTDCGSDYTDGFLSRQRPASGQQAFAQACARHGVEHRLIPRHPQTNGMGGCFNGRLAEVLQTHHFDSTQGLATTLLRYAGLYNHHVPQRALKHRTPIEALKVWQSTHPELFRKKVYHLRDSIIHPTVER